MKQQVEDVLKNSRSIVMDDSVATILLGLIIKSILVDLKSEIKASRANIHCEDLPEIVGNPRQLPTSVIKMLTTSLDPEVQTRAEEYQAVKGYLNKPLSKEGLTTISQLIPGEKGDLNNRA